MYWVSHPNHSLFWDVASKTSSLSFRNLKSSCLCNRLKCSHLVATSILGEQNTNGQLWIWMHPRHIEIRWLRALCVWRIAYTTDIFCGNKKQEATTKAEWITRCLISIFVHCNANYDSHTCQSKQQVFLYTQCLFQISTLSQSPQILPDFLKNCNFESFWPRKTSRLWEREICKFSS